MYENGRGVKKDPAKAAKWRRLAMIHGLEASPPQPPEPAATEGAESPGPTADAATPAPPDPQSVERPAATGLPDPQSVEPPAADESPAPPAVPPPPPPAEGLAPALAAIFEAADAGDPDAQYELAQRYASGNGLPRSHLEAGKWYLAAAEGGHEIAGYKLAFQYFRGRGIAKSKDLVQAHFWFSVSAERGVGDAAQWRAKIEQKLSKRQLAESEELLAEWNRR
jgi:localization factor PodJL